MTDPRSTAAQRPKAFRGRGQSGEILSREPVRHTPRLIGAEILFRSTIAGASVRPCEVARVVLEANAAAVILFPNHPSGVAKPSQADEVITKRLKETLSLIEVRVLDYLIIGDAQECSPAAAGPL